MSWQPSKRLVGVAVALLVAGCSAYGLASATGPAGSAGSAPRAHADVRKALATLGSTTPTAGEAGLSHPARHHPAAAQGGRTSGPAAGFHPLLGMYATGMPGSYQPVQ